jgi:hypothetical protein
MWILYACAAAFAVVAAMELNPRQKKRAALMKAIRERDFENVERIAASKLNLNFNYSWQFMRLGSPLSHAFLTGDRQIVDTLIARGASISPASPGNDALLSAAVHGRNFELIDLALAGGHNIHFKAPRHSKPLATAVHRSSVPMARFLISRGANEDDITLGDCRWHAMRSEMILLVRELGIAVPPEVLTAVENGEWDRPSSLK